MEREGLTLEAENLSWEFENSTLVVSVSKNCLKEKFKYEKPENILMREGYMRQEFKKMNLKNPGEGDMETCNYQ